MTPGYFLKNALIAAFSLCATVASSQTIFKVTERERYGWEKGEPDGGKVRFADGPAEPPLGRGSLRFDAPINGHGRHVRLRNSAYSGTLLSSITRLSYSTFVQVAGSSRDVPMLVLLLDLDGEETPHDVDSSITHLFFIPRFQNPADTAGIATKFGWYKPMVKTDQQIKWQYPIVQKVWQTWDALHGGWCNWTIIGNTVDTTPSLYSLSGFIARYPNARIINDQNGGGVRIQAGGTPMANNFVGNVDAFIIGINEKTTTYDFEGDASIRQQQLQRHQSNATKVRCSAVSFKAIEATGGAAKR